MIRKEFHKYQSYLPSDSILILKGKKGKERKILASKWFVNKNTPVGEDADLYERKPYGGKKYIPWEDVIAYEEVEDK